MKILFIAPEICEPFTEGRKRLVIDLMTRMSGSDELFLLTTSNFGFSPFNFKLYKCTPVKRKPFHLISILFHLPLALRSINPDIVLNFPYGSFRKLYGYASMSYMFFVDKVSLLFHVPCITLLYSLDEFANDNLLDKIVSNLVLTDNKLWRGHKVSLGLDSSTWDITPGKIGPHTLLFLAGMWQQTTSRVDHVLSVRGLSLLLKAGELLSQRDIRLVVASPLFKSSVCRNYLLNHPDNQWDKNKIILLSDVKIPNIFKGVDLFVFPYLKEINQFTPSSVVEAMLSGTGVVLTDVKFMDHLKKDCFGNKIAYTFPNNDHFKLAEVIVDALDNPSETHKISCDAKKHAVENFSIKRTVKELYDIIRTIKLI